jgi:hypothetical protein
MDIDFTLLTPSNRVKIVIDYLGGIEVVTTKMGVTK